MQQENIYTSKQFPKSPYYVSVKKERKCAVCGETFLVQNGSAKTCSPECAKIRNRTIQVKRRQDSNLAARLGLKGGVIGKINENIVAIDLLKKGYDVYIAYEDTHPFDILIHTNGKYKRVEVKTGTILGNGVRFYNKTKVKPEKHDILAIVYNLNEIEYKPEL